MPNYRATEVTAPGVGAAAAGQGPNADSGQPDRRAGSHRQTAREVANPFENDSLSRRPWWWIGVEVATGIILGPFRVVGILLAFLIAIVFGVFPLWLFSCCHDPMAPRHFGQTIALMPIRLACRILLWSLGVWWISVKRMKGCAKSWAEGRVIVANHISLADAIVIGYLFAPSMVAKDAVANMPLVGTISKAMQVIFVDRESEDSRATTLNAICARAKNPQHAPVGIFPEGTCTNGSMLIRFKKGAFAPNEPVQPVVLKYRYLFVNPANVGELFGNVKLFYMVLQPWTNIEVTLLPVRKPQSDGEMKDPLAFGRAVRDEMATYLGVPVTEHSTDDFFLWCHATRRHFRLKGVFEASALKELFGLDLTGLKDLMDRFGAADVTRTGTLGRAELCSVAGMDPDSAEAGVMFDFFDVRGDGQVDFAEFARGVAVMSETLNEADHLKLAFMLIQGDDGTVLLDDLREYLHRTTAMVGKIDMLNEHSGRPASPTRTISRQSISSITSQLEDTTSAIMRDEGHDTRLTYPEFVAKVQERPEVAGPILELAAQLAEEFTKPAEAHQKGSL